MPSKKYLTIYFVKTFGRLQNGCIFVLSNETDMTTQERKDTIELQATLLKIDMKTPVFFNISLYKKLGLVKAYGKTERNTTNWVLTDKAKMFLNVIL